MRPAIPDDARPVYEWLANSDLTPSMMGPPLFPEVSIPTWEQFCRDYKLHFFDGSKPAAGQSFIIEKKDEAIGHINYDCTDLVKSRTELDIWMRSLEYCGKGFGPDATETLVMYLHEKYAINEFILRPSERNKRAIRSYEKSGFVKLNISQDEQKRLYGPGDYYDDVLMIRKFSISG